MSCCRDNYAPTASTLGGFQTPEQEAKARKERITYELRAAIEKVAGVASELSGKARDEMADAQAAILNAIDHHTRGY